MKVTRELIGEIKKIAASDPIEYDGGLYGQGGGGYECIHCHACDYSGPIEHEPNCLWLLARRATQ